MSHGGLMKIFIKTFTLFLFHSLAYADLQVKFHYSPLANLVYQLDCVSGVLQNCSQDTYKELWKKEFSKTPEDEVQIKNWALLLSRYEKNVEMEESEKPVPAVRIQKVQLSTKLRIASFQSQNMNEYLSRLDLIIVPRDREKFEAVIRHFYPVFENWWKKTALPQGKSFVQKTEVLLKRSDIAKKIKQYAHFYEAQIPKNYEVHLNLFYRPDSDESTAGQQIENYSVSEFIPIEKPEDRIDVIIHELCHFFYRGSTDEKFASLQKSFEANAKPQAKSSFNLLNETLATAFGNGMINKLTMDSKKWEKFLNRPQSMYFNFHIDKAAKAILPFMEDWLKEGRTLYDSQFVEKYIAILEKDFGAELIAPKLMLNEMVLVADSKVNGSFRESVRKTLRPSSMYVSEGEWSDEKMLESYKELPNFSALIIIHPSNINQLKEKELLNKSDFEALQKSLKEKGQLIYGFNRSPSVPAYVISAPSFAEAMKLVEKIGEWKNGFTGVLN